MNAKAFVVRRWPWLLAGALLAAIVSLPFRIRSAGLARYAAAKAGLAAAGMAGGAEELRRDAPAVDPSLQARWTRVADRAGGSRLMTSPFRWKVADWLHEGGPEPEGVREVYDADAAIRADAAELLAGGMPVAGVYGGWLAAGAGPVPGPGAHRCENLIGVKGLANLFFVQAALEEDPRPALAALDRMHGVFERPGTLIDGIIGVCVAEIRDETYVRLAAARRLPPEEAARWLAEEPVEPARTVLSLRGERAFFLDPVAEGIVSGTAARTGLLGRGLGGSGPAAWLDVGGEASGWWLHGPEACARALDHYAAAEPALREGRAMPPDPGTGDFPGRLAATLASHLDSVATTALAARQRHRIARAFVRALDDPVERVIPPGGPGELPVVVERTGPGRLRVRSDTTGPLPPAWTGIAPPSPPEEGKGPSKPLSWSSRSIEADLPPASR